MKDKIYLNNNWQFSFNFEEKMLSPKYKPASGVFETVRIPHTVKETPYNSFDENMYQTVSIYRCTFKTEPVWAGKKVLVTFEGAAHKAEVYLNGKIVGVHNCGYTAFTVDLTEYLKPKDEENILCVKLDSRETLDIPPFGYVIDYMTYGGIYRDVYLEVKNPVFIQDVFVKTKSNHFESEITLNTEDSIEGYTIIQRVKNAGNADVEPCAEINTGVSGIKILTSAEAQPVEAWTLEHPVLYNVITELVNAKGKTVDVHVERFGFREISFDETGFYLNHKKIKLRGLNRHQSYPYVGYAMPKNMQIDDAEILKNELGLNYVRTSHYPQSKYFIDRCDEIGLLVFTEIPGWQHIGGETWQDVAVENVSEMIMQYRNHPSIFMWGVRINESQDNEKFYKRTNTLAHDLDPTRPTGGVRFLKHSQFFEDVYTFNDFSHTGKNAGLEKKTDVTDSHGGYLISEYNGHMFPTKAFDPERIRTEHAVRHANVLDAVYGNADVGGASGWCAFDYNTHKDFGSGDRICYHGVMDMFRNPKTASYVYRCQGEYEDVGDVLEVSSSFDIGEYPAGSLCDVWIFTNADTVKMYIGSKLIKEFKASDSPYKNLPHGPIYIDDTIGERLVNEDGVPKKYAQDVKDILYAVRRYGVDDLPSGIKRKFAKLFLLRVADTKKITDFYFKYVASWGGTRNGYKFEAYRNGKLVKTLVKMPGSDNSVCAEVKRTNLVEEFTYDVSEIRLYAKDENGNILPFCQEAVSVRAEGAVEIIGPEAVSLKGGMAGVYVKSKGKSGNGSVIIKDWTGKEVSVPFNVKVLKV